MQNRHCCQFDNGFPHFIVLNGNGLPDYWSALSAFFGHVEVVIFHWVLNPFNSKSWGNSFAQSVTHMSFFQNFKSRLHSSGVSSKVVYIFCCRLCRRLAILLTEKLNLRHSCWVTPLSLFGQYELGRFSGHQNDAREVFCHWLVLSVVML